MIRVFVALENRSLVQVWIWIWIAVAMAMQASLGATKFVVLVGAGLVGSVMIKNNKLMDFVGDLSKVSFDY